MIKRAFLVTDTHFGVNSNSVETLDMMLSYFYKTFIPTVEKNIQPNDVLIHCGDVFDNRQTINLLVMSKVVELFENLSKLFKNGIHIITGNHDIHKKNTNEITSLDCLKHIPNVYIYKEPAELNLVDDKKLLLISWQSEKNAENQLIHKHKPNYVCCHSDILNSKFDKYRVCEHGIDTTKCTNVRRIFSGHIHWSQRFGNVNLLGTPYQITRSDAENEKGFWLYDFEMDEEVFFENDFSPKFVKIDYDTITDDNLEIVKAKVLGNKLDLYVSDDKIDKRYKRVVEILQDASLKIEFFKKNVQLEVLTAVTQSKLKTLVDYVDDYVKAKNFDNQQQTMLKTNFDTLYKTFENENK